MSGAERVTHTGNEHYDLVSVLYHALKSGETYLQYIRDAEEAGDEDCAEFFRALQLQDRQRAARAKDLLDKHFSSSPAGPVSDDGEEPREASR